jgi:hypothetical protein
MATLQRKMGENIESFIARNQIIKNSTPRKENLKGLNEMQFQS